MVDWFRGEVLKVDGALLFLDVKGKLLEFLKLFESVLRPFFTLLPFFMSHIWLSPFLSLPYIIPYELLQNAI